MSACSGAAWQGTIVMLQEFASSMMEADVIAFNSALSACGEVQRWTNALRMLLSIRNHHLQSTIVSYSAAMTACEGRWLLAWYVFQQLCHDGIPFSAVPFNAVASACEKAAEWENALQVVLEVQRFRLSTIISFASGISACEKSLEWQRSLQLLAELPAKSFKGWV